MGAVPFQDAKWPRLGKRVMSADLDQQPGRAGGSDAVQVRQRGAGGGEQSGELGVGGLPALVDTLEVADQLHGRCESDNPGTSTEPCQAPAVRQSNK